MYLLVEPGQPATVQEPENCTALSIRLSSQDVTRAQIDAAVTGMSVGSDGSEITLIAEQLRQRARASLGSCHETDWETRFDAMMAYAESKGWYNPDTGTVRAHIEEHTGRP